MRKALVIIITVTALIGQLLPAEASRNQNLSREQMKVDREAIAWSYMENIESTSPAMFIKLLPKTFSKSKLQPPAEGKFKTYRVALKVTPEYEDNLGKRVKAFVSINVDDSDDIWIGFLHKGLTSPDWTTP